MFVYSGEDTFESYKAAKAELKSLAEKSKRETKIIDEDDISSLNDFLYKLESVDIFGSSPILLAKRILNNKDIANYLAENIAQLKNLELVIWQDKALDAKTKLYKTLTLHNLIKNYPVPKPAELKMWVKNKAQCLKLSLSEEVLNFIIENVTQDKWILEKELEKLTVIELQKPTIKDIKELFGLTIKGDIWKFIDSVGNRDKVNAIKEFEKLSAYEDNSQLIISLLQREFRIIAQINATKGNTLKLNSLGLAPFIIKKSQPKAKKYTFNEVKEYVGRLLNLDYAIKTGEIDDKIGLTLFLLTL